MLYLDAVQDIIQTAGFAPRFGQWDFGDGVLRAGVFTTDPAPEEAPNPVCILSFSGGTPNPGLSTRIRLAQTMNVLVVLWGNKTESNIGLRTLAHQVFDLFFTQATSILVDSDWRTEEHTITTPSELTDGDGFPGYSMVLTITASKERRLGQ